MLINARKKKNKRKTQYCKIRKRELLSDSSRHTKFFWFGRHSCLPVHAVFKEIYIIFFSFQIKLPKKRRRNSLAAIIIGCRVQIIILFFSEQYQIKRSVTRKSSLLFGGFVSLVEYSALERKKKEKEKCENDNANWHWSHSSSSSSSSKVHLPRRLGLMPADATKTPRLLHTS